MRSFYEILGISRCATEEEIIAAYRKRVIETHPDRGGDPIEFQNVRKGYEILSNINVRKQYDKWLIEKEQEEINQKRNKENKEKISKALEFKKRISGKFLSIMNANCMNTELYKDICRLYNNRIELFYDLPESSSNSVIAAIVILRCISLLPRSKPYFNIKAHLYLASACKEILEIEKYREKNVGTSNAKGNQTNTTQSESFSFLKTIVTISGLIALCIIFATTDRKSDKYVDSNVVFDTKNRITYNKQKKYPISNKVEIDQKNTDTNETIEQTNYSNDENAYNYEEKTYYTGDIPYESYYGKGIFDKSSLSELKFINSSSTDAVVLLCMDDGEVIRHNYIKKNATFSMKDIPLGIYFIKVMFGNSWNPQKDNGERFPIGGFMKNVSFMKSTDNDTFNFVPDETYDGVSYPSYTVTLYKVQNGNLHTDDISQKDFFN